MNFATWDLAKAALAALSSSKASGHPIQSDDWNRLVAGVNALVARVEAENQARKDEHQALVTTVSGINTRLTTLEQSVTPLLQNYLVTLASSKGNYALGEACELTVRVTDLRGQLISGRPWVDLFSSWGKLSAKAGFESRVGVGSDSLSVRVNAQGIAQVLLRAGGTSNFSDMEYRQMEIMLQENVSETGTTMAQAVMSAPSPSDHRAKSAFKVASKHYEKAGGSAMRSYTEARVSLGKVLGYGRGSGEWEEYAATVMAFAKPDADPLTADGARGTATIQVLFRDWVPAWGFDYVDEVEVDDSIWGHVFQKDRPSLQEIHDHVDEILADKGELGRYRVLGALQKALDKVDPSGDPWITDVRDQTQQALGAQKAAEAGGKYQQGTAVMGAIMAQGTRTQTATSQAQAATAQAQQAKGMADKVNVLEGRMQSAEKVGAQIQGSLELINENVRGINALDEASLKGGIAEIRTQIAALKVAGLKVTGPG